MWPLKPGSASQLSRARWRATPWSAPRQGHGWQRPRASSTIISMKTPPACAPGAPARWRWWSSAAPAKACRISTRSTMPSWAASARRLRFAAMKRWCRFRIRPTGSGGYMRNSARPMASSLSAPRKTPRHGTISSALPPPARIWCAGARCMMTSTGCAATTAPAPVQGTLRRLCRSPARSRPCAPARPHRKGPAPRRTGPPRRRRAHRLGRAFRRAVRGV